MLCCLALFPAFFSFNLLKTFSSITAWLRDDGTQGCSKTTIITYVDGRLENS